MYLWWSLTSIVQFKYCNNELSLQNATSKYHLRVYNHPSKNQAWIRLAIIPMNYGHSCTNLIWWSINHTRPSTDSQCAYKYLNMATYVACKLILNCIKEIHLLVADWIHNVGISTANGQNSTRMNANWIEFTVTVNQTSMVITSLYFSHQTISFKRYRHPWPWYTHRFVCILLEQT